MPISISPSITPNISPMPAFSLEAKDWFQYQLANPEYQNHFCVDNFHNHQYMVMLSIYYFLL